MQPIHQYLSTNDLWALAAIAVAIAILAANSSYQKHRALASRDAAADRSERYSGAARLAGRR